MSDPSPRPDQVRNNTGAGRFELEVGDRVAFINYRILTRGELALIHTDVPEALSGQGIGSTLVRGVLDVVEEKGWTVLPYCPFVHGWMKRHRDYAELVSYRYPKRDELLPEPEADDEEEGDGGQSDVPEGAEDEGVAG